MRRTIGETLERAILLQIGAAAATREKIEEVVNGLIERGRIEREEGRAAAERILSRARALGGRSQPGRLLRAARPAQGRRATHEAYEDLLFRVEQLEHRVRLLDGRSTAPSPERPPESAVPPVSEPPPPVGGMDVAPQPLQD